MKKLLFVINTVLFFCYSVNAQVTSGGNTIGEEIVTQAAIVDPGDGIPVVADRVMFSYDESGNQKQRRICINCTTNKNAEPNEPIVDQIEDKIIEDKLTFYPNPVLEELHIDFDLSDNEKVVKTVEIYTITGQVIKVYSNIETQENLIVPFNNLPQGVYIVNVTYNNGETVDLKILKK